MDAARAGGARGLPARADRRRAVRADVHDRALRAGARRPARAVAGVGNIYADEALWRARIHPLRPAGELRREELATLRAAVRKALELGIARQGATLRDYRGPGGESGRMQLEFQVYGREGEPCPRCGTPIEKIRAAGRGTWYCPVCQTLEPRL